MRTRTGSSKATYEATFSYDDDLVSADILDRAVFGESEGETGQMFQVKPSEGKVSVRRIRSIKQRTASGFVSDL